MTRLHLLPSNATQWERDLSTALDRSPVFGPKADEVAGVKYQRPLNVTIAQAYVVELGLGPVSRFFSTAEALVDEGVPWQRIRGTPAAIEYALRWSAPGPAYAVPEVLDQSPGRRKWNRYQIAMGELPGPDEVARLTDVEYLAALSDAARSVPYRGFHGYDVRSLRWGNSRWSGFIWGDDSGVRLAGQAMKWSHGRDHSLSYEATAEDRENLGVDVSTGDALGWGDYPWNAPGMTWGGITDAAAFRSFLVRRLPAYVAFMDGDGEVIGYRRCYDAEDLTEDTETAVIRYRARTGFGDGAGRQAESCALVLRAGNIDASKPGKAWLGPDDVAFQDGYEPAQMTLGPMAFAFLLHETVREHVTITLEI